MSHQSTRAKVRDKLIPTLAQVESGSRELDIVLCYVLGDSSSPAGQMIHLLVAEGYPWDIIAELLDEELPAYSRSLDAALPGEEIGFALHSRKRRRWAALQRRADGRDILAWAATECLARRQAALKAIAADAGSKTRPRAPQARGAEPRAAEAARPKRAPPTGRDAAAAEPGGVEWKILF